MSPARLKDRPDASHAPSVRAASRRDDGGPRRPTPGRTKRLYLYRGTFADAPWLRRGEPMPEHVPPKAVDMQWLSAAEWRSSPSSLPTPAALVERRFAEGGHCLVMRRRDTGALVYHLWLSAAGAWVEWIGARVTPPPGYALVFDVWAHRDWRTGRLHLPGAREACRRMLDELGLAGLAAGVEAHEMLPFASMYARAGLGLIEPYEVVVWRRLGPISGHKRLPPPATLVDACAAMSCREKRR